MTVFCKNFHCTSLPDGTVRLDIDGAKPSVVPRAKVSPGEDKLLTRADVAGILGVTTRTVTNLQTREKNPLVFSENTGRPRIWASVLAKWLENDPRGAAARAATLFAPKVDSTPSVVTQILAAVATDAIPEPAASLAA